MSAALTKENPPPSGNSGEGMRIGASPVMNSGNERIAYPHKNFNRSEKFNFSLLENVKGSGGQYTARCPAHEDKHNSLSIKIDGDRVLLYCFAGCSAEKITGALGLTMSALFLREDKPSYRSKAFKQKQRPRQINSVTYEYQDPHGDLAYRKIRYEYSDGSKTFAFYSPDGKKGIRNKKRFPYNLPAVLKADRVYFVEGEKAADAIIRAGYVATSLDAGANSKWLKEYNAYFEGKKIFILPDNDEAGIKYAINIADCLKSSVIKVLPNLPDKGDVFDWLQNGHKIDEIDSLPEEKVNISHLNSKSKYTLPIKFDSSFDQKNGFFDQNLISFAKHLASFDQNFDFFGQTNEVFDQNLISFAKHLTKFDPDLTKFDLVNENYSIKYLGEILPGESDFIPINPFENPKSRALYRWDDIGISNLFADCYKNVSRYVPEARSWYVYNGRVWKQDTGGVSVAQQAKRFMYYLLITCMGFIDDDEKRTAWAEFVVRRMKKQARDSMVADAASCYPVSILDFDKDPYIFNCQNITLDLKTFAVHKHSPGDFLSKISGVIYDEKATCPRWEGFINEIMQGDTETAEFLQKALGYTLTGNTSEECFFILYGSTTRNGKGTTMETTLRLMGDYGRTAQPETVAQKQFAQGGGPSEDIARLKGARFVNMSEPDKGLRLNSALVKQVTGGDTVTARFLHQNSFEYRPEYKLFINTNHLPRVTDDSIFASGRVKLIPFERHFPESEQDKGLKAFFKEPRNISGIFNWFLEGLRLMQDKGLKQPWAVKDATNQYREESDTVGLFMNERLIEVNRAKTPLKDIYQEYENWCDENGRNPLNKPNLTAELRRKGMKIDRSDKGMRYLFDHALVDNQEIFINV